MTISIRTILFVKSQFFVDVISKPIIRFVFLSLARILKVPTSCIYSVNKIKNTETCKQPHLLPPDPILFYARRSIFHTAQGVYIDIPLFKGNPGSRKHRIRET